MKRSYPDDLVIGDLSRRGFLKGVGATGVLLVAANWGWRDALAAEKKAFGADAMPHGWVDNPKIYVSIDRDGTVGIVCNRSEMGQGVRASLAMVVADELEADWSRVKVIQAPGDEARYGNQDTDGSRSMRHWFEPMRRCGAAARRDARTGRGQPVEGPAGRVPRRTEQGAACAQRPFAVLRRTGRGRRGSRSAGARQAAAEEARAVPLHRQGRGARHRRRRYRQWPRRLRLRRALRRHALRRGRPAACLRRQAQALRRRRGAEGAGGGQGDRDRGPADPVRVPAAGRGRRGGAERLGGDQGARGAGGRVGRRGQRRLRLGGLPQATGRGSAQAGQGGARQRRCRGAIRQGRGYRRGRVLPAAPGPGADGTAGIHRLVQGRRLRGLGPDPGAASDPRAHRRAPETAVRQGHGQRDPAGGGFGRKSKPDFVLEAAILAKAFPGRHLRVQWTREDDLHFSYFHTVSVERLQAVLGADGLPQAWLHRSVAPASPHCSARTASTRAPSNWAWA